MSGSIIFQLFFPSYMGSHSGYGISVGWQREIGIWNMAVLVILIAVNLKYDWFYLRTVLVALIIGGFGVGPIIFSVIFTIICRSMGLVRLKIISLSLVGLLGGDWNLLGSRRNKKEQSKGGSFFIFSFFLTKFVKRLTMDLLSFLKRKMQIMEI